MQPTLGLPAPQFYTLPTMPSPFFPPTQQMLFSPTDQQGYANQVPAKPVIQAVQFLPTPGIFSPHYQFSYNQSSQVPLAIDTDMISPTDTISTYALSPWSRPSVDSLANDLIPGTQVFDLVNGLQAIDLEQEQQHLSRQGYGFGNQDIDSEIPRDHQTSTRKLDLLGGQSAAIRLERVARAANDVVRRSV